MIKMGMKTIEDYTFVPWFLENSIFFDVYIEWRNFATQGMKRLDGLNKRKMELYMMREKDFLNLIYIFLRTYFCIASNPYLIIGIDIVWIEGAFVVCTGN